MNFSVLRSAVTAKFKELEQYSLFFTSATKDELWETYLGSFDPKDNPLHITNTVHDCNCCRDFIKTVGNVVAVNADLELESVWDIDVGEYQYIADAMASLVKSRGIRSKFLTAEEHVGRSVSRSASGIDFEHLYHTFSDNHVVDSDTLGRRLSDSQVNRRIFKESLDSIKEEAVTDVLSLIYDDNLYLGDTFKSKLENLKAYLSYYNDKPQSSFKMDLWLWDVSSRLGNTSRYKNGLIGTLLKDLSEGVDLETAVIAYEVKAAPENRNRSKKIVSKVALAAAEKLLEEKGLIPSLDRRHATSSDIHIDDVLYVDRSVNLADRPSIFQEMISETPKSRPKHSIKVGIDDFMSEVVPSANKIQVYLESQHTANFVNIIAPVHKDTPVLTKWSNNITMSYAGELTDASQMQRNVKSAGGLVDAPIRFSIEWNNTGYHNTNDLDIHCKEPDGLTIYFPLNGKRQVSSGLLDIDVQDPIMGKPANENITYTDIDKMPVGNYNLLVHKFSGSSPFDFDVEVKVFDKLYTLSQRDNKARRGIEVDIGVLTKTKDGKVTFNPALGCKEDISSRKIWGLSTLNWHTVSMIMDSPNYWEGESCTGNQHKLFMLKDCKNDESARGFYTEFLPHDLQDIRKSLEMYAARARVSPEGEQLAGLGFSSTLRKSALFSVMVGTQQKVYEVKF